VSSTAKEKIVSPLFREANGAASAAKEALKRTLPWNRTQPKKEISVPTQETPAPSLKKRTLEKLKEYKYGKQAIESFNKVTEWSQNNQKLIAGTTVTLLVLGTATYLGVKYFKQEAPGQPMVDPNLKPCFPEEDPSLQFCNPKDAPNSTESTRNNSFIEGNSSKDKGINATDKNSAQRTTSKENAQVQYSYKAIGVGTGLTGLSVWKGAKTVLDWHIYRNLKFGNYN